MLSPRFRAFGPLRYARITVDHDTGRSRGTGFVCFWNIEDADKVIEQSEILRKETTGDAGVIVGHSSPHKTFIDITPFIQPKKNPFKLPSLLTPDPSASVSQSLVLQGRTLDVIRAVTRDEAGKLKEAGEKQREKADKRNLYLLREGSKLTDYQKRLLFSLSRHTPTSYPPKHSSRRITEHSRSREAYHVIQRPPRSPSFQPFTLCLQNSSERPTAPLVCDRAHAQTIRYPRNAFIRIRSEGRFKDTPHARRTSRATRI